MPRACHVRTQPNNHRCAKRTTSSALHRRREQIERRFERPERVCANGVDLACPLRENRRPIPTEVSCGHFWRHLLVTKDGKDFLAGNSRKVGMFPTLSQPDSVKKYMRFRPWPKSGSPQPPDAEGCIGPPAASDTSSAGHGLTNGGRAYIPDNLYTILASPSKASFPRRQKVSFRARGTTRGNH